MIAACLRWIERVKTDRPLIAIHNQSSVDVLIWINGGGPAAKVEHGQKVNAYLPPHLHTTSQLNIVATTTVSLLDGVSQLPPSVVEVNQWQLRSHCHWSSGHELVVPELCGVRGFSIPMPTLLFIVRAQLSIRLRLKRVRAGRELEQATGESNIQRLTAAIQNAVHVGVEEDDLVEARAYLAKLRLAVRIKARAASKIQGLVRNWLKNLERECPICLDKGE